MKKPDRAPAVAPPAGRTPPDSGRGSWWGLTGRQWWMVAALVAVWAVLHLPHLRTSPNWYGDEGEWMEKCWTFIHGTPRVGPIINDFVFPYPYPPLYMLINGALLRLFGNDLVVGRALGAVTALAAAGILFWIGCRLRDKLFGFLCAGGFLVYREAVINFRWVRSHPLAGVLALAAVGFLVRYVQEKRLRDAVWAGVFCSLATATNYFTYPLIGAVGLTVALTNWREWKVPRAWGHLAVAGLTACAYAGLFVLWYGATRGWPHLLDQVRLLTSVASNETTPTLAGELRRFAGNVWSLGFQTPTQGPPPGWSGRDWWLCLATAGFVFLPTKQWRLRWWVPFWLLVLMFGVFKKLNNVPLFFYPATLFLPLMAVGFAGVMTWLGEAVHRLGLAGGRALPGVVACGLFGLLTLPGALTHFDTKIDYWTQRSSTDAEAAMQYVNAHTTADDFVLVPKQIYWLVNHARKSMLSHCGPYTGRTNGAWPVPIPRDAYWFDCRWQNAKYAVIASAVDERGQAYGIDLIYTLGVAGGQEVVAGMVTERWPVAYPPQAQVVFPAQLAGRWPVVVHNGEYLVLANPRLVTTAER